MAVEDLSGVYNVTPYSWDGKERPNLADYTAPWQEYASKVDSQWNTEKWRDYQNSVNYARDQLKIAQEQYNADLDFWNERDSRDYNDPVSQTNRYKEAGYNLGYLYGSVDSGNTSSGYAGSPAQIEDFGSDAPEKGLDDAVGIVTGALRVVTDLAKSGVDLAKMPSEIALNKWRKSESIQRGLSLSLQNAWTQFLRSVDKDGKQTDDFSKSLAFALEQVRFGQIDLSNSQMQSFLKYCDKIYENQSTDIRKELMKDADNIIKDIDSDVGSAILRLLVIMAISEAQK